VEAEPKLRERNIFKKPEQHAVIEIRGFRRYTLKFRPNELGLARQLGPEGNHIASFEPIFKGVRDFFLPIRSHLEILNIQPQVEVSLTVEKFCNLTNARPVLAVIGGEDGKVKRVPRAW
jgi:hypothetical protein